MVRTEATRAHPYPGSLLLAELHGTAAMGQGVHAGGADVM